MKLSDFDYNLPEERIAQEPLSERDASRLLVLDKSSGAIEHTSFRKIGDYLLQGDLLVLNDTRVTALKLVVEKQTGAKVELLYLKRINGNAFEALAKPAKRLRIGDTVIFANMQGEVVEITAYGGRIIRFNDEEKLDEALATNGIVPLPPYIHKRLDDSERYQTVFASHPGSAAAPTAGLHFTNELLSSLRANGVSVATITLDVSIDTFRPVRVDDVSDHKIHGETYEITEEAAEQINSASGRIIAVGTTTVRTLESAVIGKRRVRPGQGTASLFIKPGFQFQVVGAMLTNFHLPKTTMLLMVSAMAGRSSLFNAYSDAIAKEYRFLSFGDSMLIIERNN